MSKPKDADRDSCASHCSSSSELMKHIDNLETLVVRMARFIEKTSDGDSKMADQSMGYIKRKAIGAQSILREADVE